MPLIFPCSAFQLPFQMSSLLCIRDDLYSCWYWGRYTDDPAFNTAVPGEKGATGEIDFSGT